MKKIFGVLLLIIMFASVKAQNARVEIYDVVRETIIAGIVSDSIGDSLYLYTDNLELMAFAKVDLQGLNYNVSDEIKKLQKKLVRAETKRLHIDFPGKYQMNNGEYTKGRIMYLLAKTGIVCAVVGVTATMLGLPVFIVSVVVGASKIMEISGVVFLYSLCALAAANITGASGSLWSIFDRIYDVEQKVRNRYYFTGKNLHIKQT